MELISGELNSPSILAEDGLKGSPLYQRRDSKALPSWALSRGKKIVVSLMILALVALFYVVWRYGIYIWLLERTLSIRFVYQVSWAYVVVGVIVALVSQFLLFSRIWFKNTVGAQRTPGNAAPIQTSTKDLLKKMEPSALPPGKSEYAENLFLQDSIQDFVEYSEKRKRRKLMSSNLTEEPLWFSRSTEEEDHGGLSELQQNLYRGCSQLIANLDIPTFQELYSYSKWVHLDQGESAYKSGDSGDSGIFFIVEGQVSVYGQNPKLLLSVLLPGESFGETELFEEKERQVSVIAAAPSELVQISRESFLGIVGKHPESLISFIRTTMARHWKVASFVLDHYFRFNLDKQARAYASDSLAGLFSDNLPGADSVFENELELNAGDLLYVKGSKKTNKIFVLVSGSACVYCDGEIESRKGQDLGPGTVFGSISFFLRCPRVETVRVLSRSKFLWCTIQQLELRAQDYGSTLALKVATLICPKISNFQSIGFSRAWFTAGETLFAAGSPADALYIVMSGRIRIIEDRPGPFQELGRGECVGEMSFLTNRKTHSLTAIALRDSILVRISRKSLDNLVGQNPHILKKLSETMANRIDQLHSRISGPSKFSLSPSKSKVSTVAVFPADPMVDVEGFSRNLCRALSRFGLTSYINKEKIIAELQAESLSENSSDSALRRNLTNILTDHEDAYEFVVFSALHERSMWSECCIRQADLVFIAASSEESPDVSRLESELLWMSESKTFSRKELVLIHPDYTFIPEGTNRWFKQRKLHTFHHVKETKMKFYQRLARYIAGKTVGVVFGGGGARGLAHHGVLRCLEEKNIAIDFICGTSQGSFMAAMYAFYLSREGMEKDVVGFSAKMGNIWELLSDSTLPIMSYFSGRKFSKNIKQFFNETRIEDLWIQYFCVTTNMSTSDICVHRTGSLWKAVRASMSILDYLPPMSIDGELLIDGGYINNLPVDVMKELFDPHIVIAVDVENKTGILFEGDAFGSSLSGWWLLGHKMLGWIMPFYKGPHTSIPRFAEIVYSLLYLNHNRNVRKLVDDKLMDIYIAPELGNTMLLDYHKFAEISEIGYRYSKICITEWQLRNRHLLGEHSMMNTSKSFDGSSIRLKQKYDVMGRGRSITGNLDKHNEGKNYGRSMSGFSNRTEAKEST